MKSFNSLLTQRIAREKLCSQARVCEILRHYVWAAIVWRRAGKPDEADKCERIVQAMAENSNIKFMVEKPVIVK
jgi:hypothetical protein